MKRAWPRRSVGVVVASIMVLALHEALLRAMAHGHVAHVLLGSGSSAPPLGAALLAIALVVVRLVAIVVVPGALLVAAVGLVGHRLRRHGGGSTSTGISVAEGTGTSMGVRGTE